MNIMDWICQDGSLLPWTTVFTPLWVICGLLFILVIVGSWMNKVPATTKSLGEMGSTAIPFIVLPYYILVLLSILYITLRVGVIVDWSFGIVGIPYFICEVLCGRVQITYNYAPNGHNSVEFDNDYHLIINYLTIYSFRVLLWNYNFYNGKNIMVQLR
ncbi:hypothetical protein BDA99DRAFT_542166 [Phascolomyces articulosus]|uniref:Uncharacterized protein n=1 Tax=Phascolomyces articulosus TaxID=60185 RepID=A0AAD5P996_9FUNG|nr:hypothetical protein BDA99DRAFT_542166 [Phascolomyces articulosus]